MCVFLCNKASGCANAPSPLTGLAIVCARVRTMRRRQLWTNVHNPIPVNVHNSIAAPAATIVRECPRFGIKSGTLGGLWLWSYYWILWKGKMLLIKERRFYSWLKQCGVFFGHRIAMTNIFSTRLNGVAKKLQGSTERQTFDQGRLSSEKMPFMKFEEREFTWFVVAAVSFVLPHIDS